MRRLSGIAIGVTLAAASCGGSETVDPPASVRDTAPSEVTPTSVGNVDTSAPGDSVPGDILEIEGDGYRGVILADAWATQFPEQWMPTADDITELEMTLPDYFEEAIASATTDPGPPGARQAELEMIATQLPTYLRQYAGVHDGAERAIFVNAFCPEHAIADWRTQPVLVAGGGTCFWSVLWHTGSGAFTDLLVNGPF